MEKTTIAPLFLDSALQEEFEREGFVIVPLLGPAEVERLLRFYHAQDRGALKPPAFHYSMDHPDSEYVRRVMDELIEVAGSALQPKLCDSQIVTASFVVKEGHPRGVVPPHQDWTFVDETRFRSATVWIPLVDVDFQNGALGAIHGSHRFFPGQVRCSPSPQCKSVLSDHLWTIFPYLDIRPLPAGHAFIFDNATIHGSAPNFTSKPRIAAGLGVTRAEASLRHTFLLPSPNPPETGTYAVERAFFTRYGNDALSKLFAAGAQPDAQLIEQRPYVLNAVSKDEMLDLIRSHPKNKLNEVLAQGLQAVLGGAKQQPGNNTNGAEKAQAPVAPAPAPVPAAAQAVTQTAGSGKGRSLGPLQKLQALFTGRSNAPQVKSNGSSEKPASARTAIASDPAQGVGRFYDEQHDAFLKVYGNVIQAFRTKNVSELLNYQAESMGLQAGMRVLDAGCGVAGPAIHFARERGVEVEAVTVSAKQAETARKSVESAGLEGRIHITRADYHTIAGIFPANHFDAIYFLESFGHSHDKRSLLQACFRVLKPGGVLYVKDLFAKEPLVPEHAEPIRREIQKINDAYHYNVADLYDVLRDVRTLGYILANLKTIDLELSKFENLTISNDFQELTGIARIEDWKSYIFPVEFYELKCFKPWYDLMSGNSRYFLQNLYHLNVLGTSRKDL